MLEDDAPRPRPTRVTKHSLDSWDVADLREYITELRDEIARAEAGIARKESKRAAAEAFFRSSGR